MKEGMFRKVLVCAIIILFIGTSFVSAFNVNLVNKSKSMNRGNWLYVGGSGPNNYTSIQSAINDANNGDTVFVYDDSSPYFENVVVDKSINLIGEDSDTTVIDGINGSFVVHVEGYWVSISGFTIKSGDNAGIYMNYVYNNNITGNKITSNNGDGIDLGNSMFNTINSNTISLNGHDGIHLRDAYSNIISGNNIILNSRGGIFGEDHGENSITGNIITNNTISDNSFGISLFESNNSNISNNNIVKNDKGIWLFYSSDNKIIGNSILNNSDCGIDIYKSCNNTILENNIGLNVNCGIFLRYNQSNNNIILENSFLKDGLRVLYSYQNTVSNNTINGKPLVYLENEYNKVINDAGQVILVNCDNITIQNQELSYTIIGIELLNTNNCLILKNKISNNSYYGVEFRNSCNNKIIDNTISKNYRGIWFKDSNNNYIRGNNVGSNRVGGIELDHYNSNNTITENNITSNNNWGILLDDSSNTNSIYHNNFVNHTIINAEDYCNNIWDNGYPSGGNYWDDYNGIDADGDGIGDTPYRIPGGGNKDSYPLMEPWGNQPPDPPIISGPIQGKVGVKCEYNFSLSDPNGDSMYLRVDWGNGTPSPWQGPYDSDTTVKLNHTWDQKGTYTIKAQAKDIYGGESDWSTLIVTMPVNQQSSQQINQQSSNRLLLKMLQRFLLNTG